MKCGTKKDPPPPPFQVGDIVKPTFGREFLQPYRKDGNRLVTDAARRVGGRLIVLEHHHYYSWYVLCLAETGTFWLHPHALCLFDEEPPTKED